MDRPAESGGGGATGMASGFSVVEGIPAHPAGERDRALMLKPAFKRGIGSLRKFGYTFDILIFPDQLGYTRDFVASFPDQPFIIDHIAKPYIRDRFITEEWKDVIRAVAAFPNVSCKIGGMVTEADWKHWKPDYFRPYLDTVVEAFGLGRIVFGSTGRFVLWRRSMRRWLGSLRIILQAFPRRSGRRFWRNAARFYSLQGARINLIHAYGFKITREGDLWGGKGDWGGIVRVLAKEGAIPYIIGRNVVDNLAAVAAGCIPGGKHSRWRREPDGAGGLCFCGGCGDGSMRADRRAGEQCGVNDGVGSEKGSAPRLAQSPLNGTPGAFSLPAGTASCLR